MTAILELRNVTKIYTGGLLRKRSTVALDRSTLSIGQGQPTDHGHRRREWQRQDHHGHAVAGLSRAHQR